MLTNSQDIFGENIRKVLTTPKLKKDQETIINKYIIYQISQLKNLAHNKIVFPVVRKE